MLTYFVLNLHLSCYFLISIFPDNYMNIPATSKPLSYLALGDSYTIGEGVEVSARWPNQLAMELNKLGVAMLPPEIIATTGWRTDELKAAILDAKLDKIYDLVSLLIGVNNQYQGKSVNDYDIEFEALLKLAIELGGGHASNVFVVSIPDYGFTPFGLANKDSITKEINEYNLVNKRIANHYKVSYFDITDISRMGLEDPTLIADDGLHPSGKMYSLWVNRILQNFTVK